MILGGWKCKQNFCIWSTAFVFTISWSMKFGCVEINGTWLMSSQIMLPRNVQVLFYLSWEFEFVNDKYCSYWFYFYLYIVRDRCVGFRWDHKSFSCVTAPSVIDELFYSNAGCQKMIFLQSEIVFQSTFDGAACSTVMKERLITNSTSSQDVQVVKHRCSNLTMLELFSH